MTDHNMGLTVAFAAMLNVNPEPWAIGPLATKRVNGGRSIPFVAANRQLVAFKEALGQEIREVLPDDYQIVDGECYLNIVLSRNNATYVSAKGRKVTRKSPDCTNMQKAVEDAIQGILIVNDTNVTRITSCIEERGTDADGYVFLELLVPPTNRSASHGVLSHSSEALYTSARLGGAGWLSDGGGDDEVDEGQETLF